MSARYTCPGVGRQSDSGRMGAVDPTAPCPVCGHRARVRMDGAVGAHTLGQAEYERVSGSQPAPRPVVGYLADEVGLRPIHQEDVDAGRYAQDANGEWFEVSR